MLEGQQRTRLLQQVRDVIRRKHLQYQAYIQWAIRYPSSPSPKQAFGCLIRMGTKPVKARYA